MPDDNTAHPFADTTRDDRSASPMRPHPGLILAEKYKLIEIIGEGGMGAVWRAQRLFGKRTAEVAVKLMTVPDMSSNLALERFEREAWLAATLRGPHVVQVLDHGMDSVARMPYLVMELLEGQNLAERRRRVRFLPPKELLAIFEQLERPLTQAHGAGIVHRDLKPENIFLVRNGDETIVKLLDFGVAKSLAPLSEDRPVTADGRLIGTAWYMSPEQFRGKKDLDHRVDLWSLACIASECLTGKTPFHATDLPALDRMLRGGERPLPSDHGHVPDGFDRWFGKATASNVERRFQSVKDLVDALRPICQAAPVRSPAAPRTDPGSVNTRTSSVAPLSRTTGVVSMPFLRKHRTLMLSLGVGLFIGAVPLSMYVLKGVARRPPPTTTVEALSAPEKVVAPPQPQPVTESVAQPSAPTVPSDAPIAPSVAPVGPSSSTAETPAAVAVPSVAPVPESPVLAPPEAAAPKPPAPAPRPSRARSRTRVPPAQRPQPTLSPTEEEISGGRVIDTEL